jgi:hypothetical protein
MDLQTVEQSDNQSVEFQLNIDPMEGQKTYKPFTSVIVWATNIPL